LADADLIEPSLFEAALDARDAKDDMWTEQM
jgi:hypothetical protein